MWSEELPQATIIMSTQQVVQDLSFPIKVYVGIVHLLLLFLVILLLQRPSKNGDKDARQGRKSRTITKDDRAVTIESCEWINSTLAWFYLHAQSDENKDRTPLIVKLWLRALNKQLLKEKKVSFILLFVYMYFVTDNFAAEEVEGPVYMCSVLFFLSQIVLDLLLLSRTFLHCSHNFKLISICYLSTVSCVRYLCS